MKRSNRGKGYFYAYGQRDNSMYGGSSLNTAIQVLNFRKGAFWPIWAQIAYQHGFNGDHNS